MEIHPTSIIFFSYYVKAPEFGLFLALLIVTEAEQLLQVPYHLTARGRTLSPVSFPLDGKRPNYWSSFVPGVAPTETS
jgi:hypothetical protein